MFQVLTRYVNIFYDTSLDHSKSSYNFWPCCLAEAYKICEDLDIFSDTSLGFFTFIS